MFVFAFAGGGKPGKKCFVGPKANPVKRDDCPGKKFLMENSEMSFFY